MNKPVISSQLLLFSICVSIIVLFVCMLSFLSHGQAKVIFCDVGQGDATYVRLPAGTDLLFDTGPDNNRILSCLGKYMPFYDRTIEFVIISHSQADHQGGLPELMKRYEVQTLFTLAGNTPNHPYTYIPLRGQVIRLTGATLRFLSPAPSRLRLPAGNTNDLTITGELYIKSTRVIFTADASSSLLNSLPLASFDGNTILKIPHHGSANSISTRFLRLAHPDLTVISVGKNNPHGHPSPSLIAILKALSIPVRRTDTEGDIEIRL